MTLHALTVQQPWADAIVHLGKRVENRTWSWSKGLGGRLAIHAGKAHDRHGDQFIHGLGLTLPDDMPHGAIIGLVTLVGVHHASRCLHEELSHYRHCSPWAFGMKYHWELVDPRAVEPVPCRGALGVWRVPDDVAALVLNQPEGEQA